MKNNLFRKILILVVLFISSISLLGLNTAVARDTDSYLINSEKEISENVKEINNLIKVNAKVEIKGKHKFIEREVYTEITLKEFVNNLKNQKKSTDIASNDDILTKANPDTRYKDEQLRFQFLRVDRYRKVNIEKLENYLKGMGILEGHANDFITAAKKYDVDPIYLVAHAVHETGKGTSDLANGITVDGETTYNLWGIHAIDENANGGGSTKAKTEGWTSIEKSIDGGTKWISENYIHSDRFNQKTPYAMKFNYTKNNHWHGYATDINWPDKISIYMNEMYDCYQENETYEFDKIVYK